MGFWGFGEVEEIQISNQTSQLKKIFDEKLTLVQNQQASSSLASLKDEVLTKFDACWS